MLNELFRIGLLCYLSGKLRRNRRSASSPKYEIVRYPWGTGTRLVTKKKRNTKRQVDFERRWKNGEIKFF